MKTRFYWVALLASAALIAPAQAGGHHGGGSGFSGGGFRGGHAGGGSVPSFHSMPMRNFGGGGRMIHSGPRFSSAGRYSPSSAAFRQHYINSNRGAFVGTPQVNRGNISRGDRLTGFPNGANRAIANPRREGNGAGQVRSGNSLSTNWRSHVVAQHSGNWHRDWDRSRDHSWHGHHCRFINGSWFIFDSGFYPGSYWYPYDYYPYEYDQGVYEDDSDNYSQGAYDSSNQNTDSTVAGAQKQLARQGYYRGEIDGIFGPETRRAIMRYQSNHGLRVTGDLSTDTLQALELRGLGSN
ncbi:MAG: hypothetical protein QOH24_710 [Verrucomicrobiota bacterium]